MVRIVTIFLFCGTGLVLAQAPLGDSHYYADTRARVNDYVFRTYTDPSRIAWLLVDSAKDNWSQHPRDWDRSPESYYCRVASGFGRRIVRNTLQLGFETALHQDSRYMPSNLHGIGKRVLFAVRSSVLAYKPDGSMELAYGRIAAGVATAAISSTWQPQTVGAATLLGGMGQSAIDRAGNNLLTEFTPDLTNFGKRTWKMFFRK
jgi:hypothetical protein